MTDEKEDRAGLIHATDTGHGDTLPRPNEPAQLSYAGRAPYIAGNPPRGYDSKAAYEAATVECGYCHHRVAPRDPYHVHGHNECLCGMTPQHNRYLHEVEGS